MALLSAPPNRVAFILFFKIRKKQSLLRSVWSRALVVQVSVGTGIFSFKLLVPDAGAGAVHHDSACVPAGVRDLDERTDVPESQPAGSRLQGHRVLPVLADLRRALSRRT